MTQSEAIEFLEFIIHSNTDPVIVKNWQGQFVFANKALAKLYGTSPDKMIGYTDEYFTGNEDQGKFFLENIQRIMKAFKPELVYEDSTDTNTGEVRHFLSHKIPFINPLNELNILVMAKDITDIKRLKLQAEYNEKRLNYVLHTTKEGVWDWNLLTNEIYHNQYWYQLTGLNEQNYTFEDFQSCIYLEDRQRVQNALNQCIKNDKPYRVEFRIQNKNGKLTWVFDRGDIVERDPAGNPTRMIGAAQDITQQKHDQKQIEQLAFYDPLTNLPNRRLLQERIELAIINNQHNQSYSALMFLDLDNFKILNDTHGHNIGDKLLIEVSQRLKKVLERFHTVARFGGDEFVVIINGLNADHTTAQKQAMAWSEKLHQSLEKTFQLQISKVSNQQDIHIEYQLTASIGITLFNGKKNVEVDELLKLADLALYRAKTDGRNKTVTFDPSMQEDLIQSQKIQSNFNKSIKNSEFELFYQPQINASNQLIGLEALIRWPQKDLKSFPNGYISPGEFIPMAEETGLIIPLGNWILNQACLQIALWQKNPILSKLVISVNISAKQIAQTGFIEYVCKLIKTHGIKPNQLKFEITESVLLQDVADAIEKLQILKDRGIKVSLDDFGTGYSSLSYLKRLPVNEIKIDQSFVNDIMIDESDAIMVKTIIDLSKNFSIDVIAEGVETPDQLNKLIEFGCSQFQGYLFSKPLCISDLDIYLENFL